MLLRVEVAKVPQILFLVSTIKRIKKEYGLGFSVNEGMYQILRKRYRSSVKKVWDDYVLQYTRQRKEEQNRAISRF